jgi:cytochrome c553
MATKRLAGLCATLLLAAALPAAADRTPSRADEPAAARAHDLAQVQGLAARDDVAQALQAQGLSSDEVEARLARLSDEDLRRLAAHLDQVQAAGNVPNYIWILLGILIAVTIIATVF